MLKKKSDSIAEKHKNAGNLKYSQRDFIEALKLYNQALCYVQNREKMAIIYGNRSAVYFEIFKYKECLENIQHAKKIGYPPVKIQKLIDREENCKKQIDGQLKNEREFQEFLQLSHPPNPKIPFIVDCVELRYAKEFGRGIYATKDLSPGDIIAIETPIFMSCVEGGSYFCCNNCVKINAMNLIPCTKSASFMFCSENCRDQAYEKFPNIEVLSPKKIEPVAVDEDNNMFIWKCFLEAEHTFGGRDKLIKFVKKNPTKKWKKTIFDYDFSDPADLEKNLILASMSLSLLANVNASELNVLDAYTKYQASGDKEYEKFLKHLMSTFSRNNSSQPFFNNRFHAFYLLVLGSLFNHSCWPNIIMSYANGKNVISLTKHVKAGEQLFFNYVGAKAMESPREQRFAGITDPHHFACHCFFCENNVVPNTLKRIGDRSINASLDFLESSYVDALKNDASNSYMNKLKKIFDAIRTREVALDDHSKEAYDFENLIKECFKAMCFQLDLPILNSF